MGGKIYVSMYLADSSRKVRFVDPSSDRIKNISMCIGLINH